MKTLEEIIIRYPKTDDCELQTLGELHQWQIEQLKIREGETAIAFKNWCDLLSKKNNPECYDFYLSTQSCVIKSNEELFKIFNEQNK